MGPQSHSRAPSVPGSSQAGLTIEWQQKVPLGDDDVLDLGQNVGCLGVEEETVGARRQPGDGEVNILSAQGQVVDAAKEVLESDLENA